MADSAEAASASKVSLQSNLRNEMFLDQLMDLLNNKL